MRWNWGRRALPSERRVAPRYRPARADVVVGWWNEAGVFETIPATVRDLSQGGALLGVASSPWGPTIPAPVWVRLGADPAEPWTEARPVAWCGRASRRGSMRLAFPHGCPYGLYVALLHGGAVMPNGPDRCVDPNFENERPWR